MEAVGRRWVVLTCLLPTPAGPTEAAAFLSLRQVLEGHMEAREEMS